MVIEIIGIVDVEFSGEGFYHVEMENTKLMLKLVESNLLIMYFAMDFFMHLKDGFDPFEFVLLLYCSHE